MRLYDLPKVRPLLRNVDPDVAYLLGIYNGTLGSYTTNTATYVVSAYRIGSKMTAKIPYRRWYDC
jgi:hypothetical protein